MDSSSASSNSFPKKEQDHLAKKLPKFEGFDFLRAIFSLAVVAYKTRIFYIPKMLVPSSLTYALSDYVLSGMVGALAVPVFLQISLFIFYIKSKDAALGYFMRKRLPRLLALYLFWIISITVFDILFVNELSSIRDITSSVKNLILFIVSGNNTPYFFFFSLIFATVIAEGLVVLFSRLDEPSLKRNINFYLLIISLLLIFTLSTIEPIIAYTGTQSPFLHSLNNLARWDYSPINFLPYVSTAAITVQEYNEGKLEELTKPLKRKLHWLLALTLIFFALEWTLTSNHLLVQVAHGPLDHYMRLSLVFGSWLLLYLALLSKRNVPKSIKFLSGCSLGIYGFHVFFTFRGHLPFINISFLESFPRLLLVWQSVTAFLVAVLGAIALTLVSKRIKVLKEFV